MSACFGTADAKAAPQPVTPTLQCVFTNTDGTHSAVFGYSNSDAAAVTIPVGGQNAFSPAPADRGQPTVFQPGDHPSAFVVTYSEAGLVWNVGNANVHVTDKSPQCPTDPALSDDTGSFPAVVLLGALTLVGAAFLGRRRTILGDTV